MHRFKYQTRSGLPYIRLDASHLIPPYRDEISFRELELTSPDDPFVMIGIVAPITTAQLSLRKYFEKIGNFGSSIVWAWSRSGRLRWNGNKPSLEIEHKNIGIQVYELRGTEDVYLFPRPAHMDADAFTTECVEALSSSKPSLYPGL